MKISPDFFYSSCSHCGYVLINPQLGHSLTLHNLLSESYSILPARLRYSRQESSIGIFSKTNPAHTELSQISTGTSAICTSTVSADSVLLSTLTFGDQRFFCHLTYFLKGNPKSCIIARLSLSVGALVSIEIFIPRILSTSSISISGKINCSLIPMV